MRQLNLEWKFKYYKSECFLNRFSWFWSHIILKHDDDNHGYLKLALVRLFNQAQPPPVHFSAALNVGLGQIIYFLYPLSFFFFFFKWNLSVSFLNCKNLSGLDCRGSHKIQNVSKQWMFIRLYQQSVVRHALKTFG